MSEQEQDLRKFYIGDRKIKSTVVTDAKTPSGADVIEVTFQDGSKEVMSQKRFDILKSSREHDATATRDRLSEEASTSMMTYLMEIDVNLSEIAAILQRVNTKVIVAGEQANGIMWGVEGMVSGNDTRKLLKIYDVLVKGQKDAPEPKQDNDGAAPGGGEATPADQG